MKKHIWIVAFLLLPTLTVCTKKVYLAKTEFQPTTMKVEAAEEDTTIVRIIAPYKLAIDSKMNRIIGISEKNLVKGDPEGLLGNVVSDICKSTIEAKLGHNIDFVVLNNGGLRAPIPKGEITVRHIYELMPFENELVAINIKGKDVYNVLEMVALKGGMPVSQGFKMAIKEGKINAMSIDGKPWDMEKEYWVGTSDYLAAGGDKFDFTKSKYTKKTGLLIRESIVTYCEELFKKGKSLTTTIEGRITYEK